MIRLPVIIIISEETTTTHINIFLFLLFLFLGLFLSFLSSRSSSSRSGSSSTRTYKLNRIDAITRSSQKREQVLSSNVGTEHSRPVRSNTAASSLYNLVQILLLSHITLNEPLTVGSTFASAQSRVAREMISSSFSMVDISSKMAMLIFTYTL